MRLGGFAEQYMVVIYVQVCRAIVSLSVDVLRNFAQHRPLYPPHIVPLIVWVEVGLHKRKDQVVAYHKVDYSQHHLQQ